MTKLTPDKQNANKGTDRGRELLKHSLTELGAGRSILADKHGNIIAGNKTFTEANALGLKVREIETNGDELVVVKRNDLDLYEGTRARELAYADNRVAELDLDWEASQLAADLEAGIDLNALGFGEKDLKDILGDLYEQETRDAEPQIDRAAELLEKWQVKTGDLWLIGRHRLLCGDSTKKIDVTSLMQKEKAQITFTSPPYWVGKDYEYQNSLQEIKEFIKSICENMAIVMNTDGGRIIINTSTASARAINEKADAETLFTLAWYQDIFRDIGWLMRHCRIWIKHGGMANPSVAARSDVIDQHWEVIPEFLPTFYFPDGLRRGQEKIGTKWAQLGVWTDIQGDMSSEGHVAAFPLELPARYIKLYTKIDEIIFEPFNGSGTTLVACENLNRRGRAIEISPAYCAVTLERMSEAFPELEIRRVAA